MLLLKLTLIVIVALAAGVAARPDTKEGLGVPSKDSGTFDGSTNTIHETLRTKVTTLANRTTTKKEHTVLVEKPILEQFPHAVLFGGICGGTIISSKWVLTAGHCSLHKGWSSRFVKAGTSDTGDSDQGVRIRIKRRIFHPLFTVGPYWVNANEFHIKQVAANWDFMLGELEDELTLNNKTMMAVQLDDQTATPEGLKVGYAGFGAARHGESMSPKLHGRHLEVLPDSVCKKALPEYNGEYMLCTRGYAPNNDSACNGDSGSGAVANGKLYGVASWVENDSHVCFNGALVVFSRVSSVREWIKETTGI